MSHTALGAIGDGKARIAALLLFIHGFIEILGFAGLIATPSAAPMHFMGPLSETPPAIMAMLSLLAGTFRVYIGYGVWRMRRWGFALGIIFSTSTIITAPLFLPYGIMDTLIAMMVLAILIVVWFRE